MMAAEPCCAIIELIHAANWRLWPGFPAPSPMTNAPLLALPSRREGATIQTRPNIRPRRFIENIEPTSETTILAVFRRWISGRHR